MRTLPVLTLLAVAIAGLDAQSARGIRLDGLTWVEAEQVLTPDTVVVIPLGAAAKEHGPHLKLRNDLILADYFTTRVLATAEVVVAPTLTYHFYPAFVEYPGSTSLRLETARDVVIDICRSLAHYGPRRFYVLNTGISTLRALAPAAEALAAEGILMKYTDIGSIAEPVETAIRQQEKGTHADEIETSMVLYMDPASVDMRKAVRDYRGLNRATRDMTAPGPDAPSGVWGDATLATREKGEKIVEAMVAGILKEIGMLGRATVPPGTPTRVVP